jgi:AraC-like DNA-binding protein
MKNKILIVEDEAVIAMHIQTIVEEYNYEVIDILDTVETAIESIEATFPDLVLIDINLNKDKAGIDLGHYLLKKDSVPFIYITSYSNPITLEKAKDTRPHGYIVKPFKPSDLISTVSIVLNNFKHRSIDVARYSESKNDLIPHKIKKIIAYIDENIEKKIEIEDLMFLSNWGKRHFSRVFFSYLHVTPYRYILTKKIDKAKSLLDETSMAINQVAFEVGFKSYSNFCNAFKKIYGETPEHYKRNHKQ